MKSMLEGAKFLLASAAASAATTDLDGTVIDLAADGGYDGVLIVAQLGDVTTGSVLELQCLGSAAANGSSPTVLATTGTFTADANNADNKLLVLDVSRPSTRYVLSRLKRGTANAVVNSVLIIPYRAKVQPVTQDAQVIKSGWANIR